MFRRFQFKSMGERLLRSKQSSRERRGLEPRRLQFEDLERRELMTAVPAAPNMSAAAVSASQVNLSWNTVSNATGYLVNEWVGSNWQMLGVYGAGVTTAAITGLSSGTGYTFEVAACNTVGVAWSNVQTATTTSVAAPGAPTLTATAASSSQINLSWSSGSNATGYIVNKWVNGNWQQLGIYGTGANSLAVTGLTAGTSYTFEVAACNTVGVTWSNTKTATTTGSQVAPGAPTLAASAASSSQINLSWSSGSNATGYIVNKWVNGNWQQLGIYGAGANSLAVTGLTAGTSYTFEVAACNTVGVTWSNVQAAATTGSAPVTIDHPTTDNGVTYKAVSGTLFGASGPVYTDVHQGSVGDCWLLASLAEVAARVSSTISSMFTYQGTTVENGTTVGLYSVRLYNNSGNAVSVTVDTMLPSSGNYYDHPSGGVLWVALAEKAYAEANGKGYVTTQYVGSDSYAALNGGSPTWALQAITGKSSSYFSINPTNIAAAWNAGQFIVLGSSPNANDNYIVGDSQGTHAYAVVGYNASSSNPFELFNPWNVTSAVGATISYNGHQVYGGSFWMNGSTISKDFLAQYIGTKAELGGDSADSVSMNADAALSEHTDPFAAAAVHGDSAMAMVVAVAPTAGMVNGSSLSGSMNTRTSPTAVASFDAFFDRLSDAGQPANELISTRMEATLQALFS